MKLFVFLVVFITVINIKATAQVINREFRHVPDSTWEDTRIIILTGLGEVNSKGHDGKIRVIQIPNIVAPVAKVDGNNVWLLAPGEMRPGVYVEKDQVLVLRDAIQYFTLLIKLNPEDWDSYFRRAEAEHALNKRDEAISDYTSAIHLHHNDAYLYFRRARSFQARQMCDKAIADYDEAIRISPNSALAADAYSRQSKLYADCTDSLQRNPKKAIFTARKAIALDGRKAAYLTILASAYVRNGQIRKAIKTLKSALVSPNLPSGPGYRPDAIKYLEQLEQAFRVKKKS